MMASTMMAASRLAPSGSVEDLPDAGHQHQHTHKAVHHRGDARQQARLPGEIDGFQPCGGATLARNTAVMKPMGTPSNDGARRAVNAGQDKGQDAELRRRCRWSPTQCRTGI